MQNALLPGFRRSPFWEEQIREEWQTLGTRFLLNAPKTVDLARKTRLLIYATPNGNSIEQTLGSATVAGMDWHLDIQHIAAQVRLLRAQSPQENIFLAVVQADGLSWPTWRREHPSSPAEIRGLVDHLRGIVQGSVTTPLRITLSGHSGGGSFLWGFLNGGETIPADVERLILLDANYSYSDEDHHGDKMLSWLREEPSRRLIVLAYDDRKIEVDHKKVVGPDGGTFRASARMLTRFAKDTPFTETRSGDWVHNVSRSKQILFHVHQNPKNQILHTALVGEWNGFFAALTESNLEQHRPYTIWVQPAALIPPRLPDAVSGTTFATSIQDLSPAEREKAIALELLRGNIPDFLRTFVPVTIHGKDRNGQESTAVCEVMPDYLAVGSNTDFVRLPLTPMTAQLLADAWGCSLPTRKIVDVVFAQAAVRLEPQPLTEAREAMTTFMQHNALIETARTGKPLGALTAGIKKDVVLTNRLTEKPDRVAIYGWHKGDNTTIQPLTIVHRDTYVDYSHGIRLVKRAVRVDGKVRDLRDVLAFTDGSLFSDEGPIHHPTY